MERLVMSERLTSSPAVWAIYLAAIGSVLVPLAVLALAIAALARTRHKA
jgi:hypothetical protein